MADKPSYLGLLNAISHFESAAHCWFTAWADATPNADVRKVLRTVAAREGEHGLAFAKRIDELGFEREPVDDPKLEELMTIAASDRPDAEKFEALGVCDLAATALHYFDNVFSDHTIDIRTGELLGRYIAEEHDTARLLTSCYQQLKGAQSTASSSELAALNAKVDALCAAVEQLQASISSNGKSKAKVAAH